VKDRGRGTRLRAVEPRRFRRGDAVRCAGGPVRGQVLILGADEAEGWVYPRGFPELLLPAAECRLVRSWDQRRRANRRRDPLLAARVRRAEQPRSGSA
jgi:hypothetical protein